MNKRKKQWRREIAAILVAALIATLLMSFYVSVSGAEKTEVTAEISDDDTAQEKTEVTAEITDDEADDHVVIEADDKPYLAFGADLSKEQRKTVLKLMGIDPKNIDQYEVTTVSNAEEHQYLDSYLASSTIGTRALSSVVIVKREKGNGINISTKNITYCTVGMYKNALATAGLEDADVIVAGPFPLSGTAALIGAMKAYADMEGEKVDEESLDTAMNEIVVTGSLNDELGEDEQVEEFMAYVKQQVVERKLTDPEEIHKVLEDSMDKFHISLTDDQKEQLTGLMEKIGSLDLNVDSLKEQAGSIYENISQLANGSGGVAGFFQKILNAIQEFFSNLFS